MKGHASQDGESNTSNSLKRPLGDNAGGGKGSRLPKTVYAKGKRNSSDEKKSGEELFLDSLRYIVPLVLLGGMGWLCFQIWFAADDEFVVEESVEAEQSGVAIEELLDPETFEEAFLEANGGREYLEGLRSMQSRGRIEGSDGIRSFFLVKRSPDKSLLKVFSEDSTVTVGTEGRIAWRAVEAGDAIRESEYLTGETRKSVVASSRFFDGLVDHYLTGVGELLGLSLETLDGKEVIAVDFEFEGNAVRYFVNPDLMVVSRSQMESGESVIENSFSDFRTVGKLQLSFHQTTIVDGETVSTLEIDSLELNAGVHPLLFQKPESASDRTEERWSILDGA